MIDSILTSVKKFCHIAEEYEYFDPDIVMYINSNLRTLNQLGVGVRGFNIHDKTSTWHDFLGDDEDSARTYYRGGYDLEGNAEITDILDSTAEAPVNDEALGAFTECEDPTVSTEAQEALMKASEGMLGADYTPIALLSTQVVSGTNYQFLCEITAATPDAEPVYSIVTVYESLEDTAEITS